MELMSQGIPYKVKDINAEETQVTLICETDLDDKEFTFKWDEYNQKNYKAIETVNGESCTINGHPPEKVIKDINKKLSLIRVDDEFI